MSWAEFLIKSFSWQRMEQNSWRKVRRISYYAISHPKEGLKETSLWRIGDETSARKATDRQVERFKAEYKQYLKDREAALLRRAKQN